MVALRTTSIKSADVGTGVMRWRPATEDMMIVVEYGGRRQTREVKVLGVETTRGDV